MRSASKRSTRFLTQTSVQNVARYYASGSVTGGSHDNHDGAFAELIQTFGDKIKEKGLGSTGFSALRDLVASDKSLQEKMQHFMSDAGKAILGNTSQTPARIAVTGAAGAIGYSLLFRLAAGELLGNRPIILSCLEIPNALKAMEGVKMELKDCAFPLLKDVVVTDDPDKAFEGAEFVFLVGAFPRGKGMDRAQLLQKNAGIFSVQGKALNKTANRDVVKTLVVGNPANTNCLIAAYNAPNISPFQFSAMTRLDHNRGLSQLADKTNTTVQDISQFAIWGNHSDTQFPDIANTLIKGTSAKQLINDDKWVSENFIPTVAKRGGAIIAARGVSSAASAANAAIDQMKDWELGSNGGWVSMGVWTGDQGEKVPYGEQGVGNELYYSYPVICSGGKYKIVEGLKIDEDGKKRIKVTNDELEKERSDAGLAHRK